MPSDVVVLGVSMTKIGRFLEKSLKDGAREAVEGVVDAVGISKKQVQAAYVGNVQAGLVSDQLLIKGQVWLMAAGISDIAIVNTENVCATGGTALYLGYLDVAAGVHDCVLVLGVEKSWTEDREKFLWWVDAGTDMDEPKAEGQQIGAAVLGEAERARNYMKSYGLTEEQLARVCVKSHFNASLNPYAQYNKVVTVDEVLADKIIAEPLRRMMCAPIGDGSAAAILCSPQFARRYTTHPIFVSNSVQRSGGEIGPNDPLLPERCGKEAYERTGVGPSDIDVWEVSDPTTFTEITSYEHLGICARGEAPALIESGAAELTGRCPVNPSGGFQSRGHPFAATGIAQIAELVWQLKEQAGKRQISNKPKSGLAQIYGGHIGTDVAAVCSTTILKA